MKPSKMKTRQSSEPELPHEQTNIYLKMTIIM